MRTLIALALLALAGLSTRAIAAESYAPASEAAGIQVTATAPTAEVVDIVINFAATDGTPLEAKLTVPKDVTGPVPVVFDLHGAGPRNYDNAVQYRDADGHLRIYRYYDFFSHELARRGIAFFRMNKRGCTVEPSGRPVVDRSVFSKATPSVLLDDYAKGFDALRQRKEIDASQIVLRGESEGTRLAPQLALRSPHGIVGLVLSSYAPDNTHDTIVWQNTVGPWRNIQKLIPAANDGTLTRAEYDAAVTQDASLATKVPFASLDPDGDGVVTAADLTRLVRPRLDAILKAVNDRNDDAIWQTLVNLSSAYLLEDWNGVPTSAMLLKLNVPIAIFHGDVDGTARVEGVREAEAAFRAAGKTNLAVHVYPGYDHDLNWTVEAAKSGGPLPFQDQFTLIATLVRPR